MEPVEIDAGGLVLRRPSVSEAAQALQLLTDRDVQLWNPAPAVVDYDSAVAWCERGADWTSGRHVTLSIVRRDDGLFCGNISLFDIDEEQASAKVGYRVAPAARRRRVASSSLSALTSWAFLERGLFRIELHHAVENTASCRVARNAGYALEATLKLATVYGDGLRRDDHLHARLASD